MRIEPDSWQTGVPMYCAPLYVSRAALVRALLAEGCYQPTRRQLALYALAARIRRAFEVCR